MRFRSTAKVKVQLWGLALCCAIVGSTNSAISASELDEAIVEVFKRNKCDACHVPVAQRAKDPQSGKLLYPAHREFSYVLDLNKLRSSKFVTPGAPQNSSLYKLIVEEKMPEGAEFCFDPSCPYPPVSESDRIIVEQWINSLN
ncbi:MAG: hypothetical protein GKS00_18740 [Alphaproteobacteria bacterium]|nr:hypothetical protein [Alphaproteobacteria bacterium]